MSASAVEPERRKLSLTAKVAIGMIAGLAVGVAFNVLGNQWISDNVVNGFLDMVGTAFLNALKLLVVPLVIFSLITGVTGIGDVRMLGRVGGKALGLYLMTTALAISIAIGIAQLIGPGRGFDMTGVDTSGIETEEAPSFWEVISGIIPTNPIEAFAEGEMLQIIFYSILVGVAALMLGERSEGFVRACGFMNELMMKIVSIVMAVAPYGVFALIARVFAEEGIDLFKPVMAYVVTLVGSLLFHLFVTLMVLYWALTRLNIRTFMRKIRAAQVFAFSTASSNATIPITLRAVTQRMGAGNSVASFTVPFGATINMDGTAIMQGVATVFLANVYGIDLGIAGYLTVIAMAVLASIGTAGVPGVGMVMLTMVLTQVGLPIEGVAIILGVDRLMDMIRTAVNITGDAVVTCIVAKSENKLNREVYDDLDAGLQGDDDIEFDPEAEEELAHTLEGARR
ncbi:dicarboxylate/amino acid:cation symporter [Mycolicibacterium poriferae]|uniref:dicarboxylate/amino acid:cation symporter n=1 Tax=Mycolicibacterium poriferae TaxID=39694 RepID=UPI0024BB0A9A|nr:dicarboxylate/amino acid:cation symporter [Mycolicibacterium poriferae]